jgi:hypothetical protein
MNLSSEENTDPDSTEEDNDMSIKDSVDDMSEERKLPPKRGSVSVPGIKGSIVNLEIGGYTPEVTFQVPRESMNQINKAKERRESTTKPIFEKDGSSQTSGN